MEAYRNRIYHERLLKYAARYHKRWGVLVFDGNLKSVDFYDVPFDNGLGLLQTVPTLKTNLPLKNWWFNGHLICNTADAWKPRIAKEVVEMFGSKKMKGPIIINIRDFPWLRRDSRVPFTFCDDLLPDEFFEVEMQYPLSFYGGPLWFDILIPPPEHLDIWKKTEHLRRIPKNDKAVFRGTLTGRYTDERNARVRVCNLKHPRIDAAFTAWTNRERVRSLENAVLHIDMPPLPLPLSPKMTMEEQAAYGVQIYVPGHVASSRLAWQMCSGSVVIMIEDDCVAPDMWFSKDLQISKWNGAFDVSKNAFSCFSSELPQIMDYLDADKRQKMASSILAFARTLDARKYIDDLQLY